MDDSGVSCRMLFATDRLFVGELTCQRNSSDWGRINTIGHRVNIAFPRTSAMIARAGRPPVLANANHVLFYDPHQEYRRSPVDPRGYHCIFLAVTDDLLADVLAFASGHRKRPKRLPREAPSDRRTFLLQHFLVEQIRSVADPLLIEEMVYDLLATAVAAAVSTCDTESGAGRACTRRSHRELVESAKFLLTIRTVEGISLDELAGELYTSPFHLARVFRTHTGLSLQGYRNQLRARLALQLIMGSGVALTTLAHELGYCSLSHFSDSFLTVFGFRPSAVRPLAAGSRRSELRRILEAS
jgi:AraC family transcriptional regulator